MYTELYCAYSIIPGSNETELLETKNKASHTSSISWVSWLVCNLRMEYNFVESKLISNYKTGQCSMLKTQPVAHLLTIHISLRVASPQGWRRRKGWCKDHQGRWSREGRCIWVEKKTVNRVEVLEHIHMYIYIYIHTHCIYTYIYIYIYLNSSEL